MKIAKFRKFCWIVPMGFAAAGLAACSSWFGSPDVQVRAVQSKPSPESVSDGLYSSAVTAIDARDYGRALDYLQEAKSRDPNDVRVLNALGRRSAITSWEDLTLARDITPRRVRSTRNMTSCHET